MNAVNAESLAAFVALCSVRAEGYNLSVEMGRKFARIVKQEPGCASRSVYGFVDLSTGDMLKAASWKAPAAGVRGNIAGDTSRAGKHSIA